MLINQDLPEEESLINCTNFSPNAPQKNLLKIIACKTKKIIKKFDNLCSYFKLFKLIINCLKLFQDEILLQPMRGLLY
ncbi:hypothetical protein Tery_1133 [Trichodesmium erythraeum IMS101]|uniref:Uncharacterized protein n=1 Tax=Trichodesmium erythraeum (strain IMS101) TaxID=203124 RepID=Q116S9_TRIEI